MTILHIIVAWIFIMAGIVLWIKYRSDRIAGRNFFNFGDFNFFSPQFGQLDVGHLIWQCRYSAHENLTCRTD